MKDYDAEEILRREQRERRRAELRRRQKSRQRRKQILVFGGAGILLVVLIAAGIWVLSGKDTGAKEPEGRTAVQEDAAGTDTEALEELSVSPEETEKKSSEEEPKESEGETEKEQTEQEPLFDGGYMAEATESTAAMDSEAVLSTYAILIDLDDNTIVARRNAYDRISPASMTKILTVLVAAEHIADLDDTFTITREITDYSYRNDCTAAGFTDGETVTVRDLLYGTILPSGADAAAGLAYYVAGSPESFVDMMNDKLLELGLSETAHFTNCVGLYDDNHYCTVYDMAIILKAAVENELCREVLSAHTYTTSSTEQHPEGIVLSNWFLRRIEDKETNGEVVCAKTGYVAQSGSCAASYAVSDNGKHYICVTADTYSSWRCIYDHVAVYQKYTE